MADRPTPAITIDTDRTTSLSGGPPTSVRLVPAPDPGSTRPAGATLRLGHINIRLLMPSLEDVIIILRDANLDVLCVSETWLSTNISKNFLVFPGYRIIRLDRSARGGGVAIIYREYFRIKRLSAPSPGSSLGCLWATVNVRKSDPIVVGVA